MRWVLPLFLTGVCCFAQSYRRHNITFNAGAGIPGDDLKNLLSTSGGVGFSYGFRPVRYLMAEAGYETLFGAADVRDFEPTYVGNLRIRDYQQFLPFGGRVILPFADDRVQLYGGGGGVYIRYSERISQPFQGGYYRVECMTCALRDGVGYYAVAGASVALDRSQLFRIGGGVKSYRGATSGDQLGAVPGGIETRDRWTYVFATFGISF